VVIPFDAGVGDQPRRIDDTDGRARRRAQTDPGHAATVRKAGAQIGESGVIIEHVWAALITKMFQHLKYAKNRIPRIMRFLCCQGL
jgi:hypothetical protein